MLFNSYSYILLLLVAVALYWALPQAMRRWFVIAASLAFYMTWNLKYTLLPIFLCLAIFAIVQAVDTANTERAPLWMRLAWLPILGLMFVFEKSKFVTNRVNSFLGFLGKTRWIRVGWILVLGVLCAFKYHQFALDNINSLLRALGRQPIPAIFVLALPLGISFYSFELISYLVDAKQGRIKNPRFSDLLLFVIFWPHLIAGPIVRFRELIPQFAAKLEFNLETFVRGFDRFVWGLVQKCLLANNIAPWVDEGFIPQAALLNSTVDNWFLAVAFGLQIYFDFAAYSNMAIGSALMLGIKLPENFRFPYHAQNPSDFWSRWHMTLSRWIRDYLFFPINARFRGAHIPLYASLVGIMALVGLWHGAGWGFMLWGIMHGCYLVFYRIWEDLRDRKYPKWKDSKLFGFAWQIFTLVAVLAAWVPFRSASLGQSASMLRTMFLRHDLRFSYAANFYLVITLMAGFVALEPLLSRLFEKLYAVITQRYPGKIAGLYLVRPLAYAAGLFLFVLFDGSDTKFIYFQF